MLAWFLPIGDAGNEAFPIPQNMSQICDESKCLNFVRQQWDVGSRPVSALPASNVCLSSTL